MDTSYEVIIVGGGPAGLAAALYAARSRIKTLILERETPGGELMNIDMVENYPGYPNGVLGPDLGSNMMMQATKFSAELKFADVKQIVPGTGEQLLMTAQGEYRTKAVIIASGSHSKKLGVPGEEEFTNKGVFYCATCDGPRFAGKVVAVAGSGDSGLSGGALSDRVCSKSLGN